MRVSCLNWITCKTAGDSGLSAGRYYNDQPADYLFWQGIAMRKSGEHQQADAHFGATLDWASVMPVRMP